MGTPSMSVEVDQRDYQQWLRDTHQDHDTVQRDLLERELDERDRRMPLPLPAVEDDARVVELFGEDPEAEPEAA